ncbi:hypothetical protein ASU31_10490 [Pedobacter ginsenosidimutans]|uniref:Carbohydrate-binding protein SusD n=2 Tax=Pedobacter ginsenosidimutans TaxID=687842 RepID=A0A0T5VQ00_9SPHI|nr:hypothetical protein ASU31_10490 [Pedobacter ginsenosidimutans]
MQFGCKKLISIDYPVNKYTSEQVFSSTSAAVTAMTGVYANFRTMQKNINSGLMADEIKLRQVSQSDVYYINAVTSVDQLNQARWGQLYSSYIYSVNSIIEGITESNSIPEDKKKVLLGEAKFIRGYCYFYLVNLYGDVPLVLTTNFKTNANIKRSSKADVYNQILIDLKEAKANLSPEFLSTDLTTATTERLRPNRGAATALLARVYLYLGMWDQAETEATAVIGDNAHYELLNDLNDVFVKNNREAVWQLQPEKQIDGSTNTVDGQSFIPRDGGEPQFSVSDFLMNAFENNDLRKQKWLSTITYGNEQIPIFYKYKIGSSNAGGIQDQQEYVMVIRFAELFLIRAEARVHKGLLIGANSAESDLNTIRNRAGLLNTTANSSETMLDAIFHERQVELFTEGEQRWLDLKRSGKINEIMTSICQAKGGNWLSYKALMPIPSSEFLLNPSLRGHQNPGYSE